MRDDRAGLQGQPWVKMAHFIVLQFSRSDDILAVGKMLTVLLKHAKNPVRQHRVFLYHFGEGGLNLRLTAADALVQPFAKVVGDYACRNREQKC